MTSMMIREPAIRHTPLSKARRRRRRVPLQRV